MWFKRVFDIIGATVLLILFFPVTVLCCVAVLVEDGSPVFYLQERLGKGGRKFNIFKIRTMRKDAETSTGPVPCSGESDPRLTRVGRFLRVHHLDELPQLWNVLKGDMSMVGYRPEREFFVDRIVEQDPRYRHLFRIRPGITSPATLHHGYVDTLDKMLIRLEHDLQYLDSRSFWLDLKTLIHTFWKIITGTKF